MQTPLEPIRARNKPFEPSQTCYNPFQASQNGGNPTQKPVLPVESQLRQTATTRFKWEAKRVLVWWIEAGRKCVWLGLSFSVKWLAVGRPRSANPIGRPPFFWIGRRRFLVATMATTTAVKTGQSGPAEFSTNGLRVSRPPPLTLQLVSYCDITRNQNRLIETNVIRTGFA